MSLNVYVRGKLLLPSKDCVGIKLTTSHTPLPIFLCTAKPLLFVSVAVSHFKATLERLIRVALKDLNVTGNGAHRVDGIKITTVPPLATPPVMVATNKRSWFILAGDIVPLIVADAPVIVNCVVSVMSASAEVDKCPSPFTSAKTR